MSVLNQSGEEQVECPLCMEPLEVDDLNFFPCTCGYQICRFCWHRIRTDENGLCPACRKAYPENPADFKPLSQEEVAKLKAEKRLKDQQRKQRNTENRKHLANVRVVQRNLVFVVGLPMRLADPEVLKKHEYFGKFGKIHKVVINQSTSYAGSQGPSASAYVTYQRAEDTLRAIQAVNNIVVDGRTIKASLGTTKYCSHFMKNQTCPKPDCMYLHDFGDPEASFTKEEMQQGKHQEYERKLHEQLLNTFNQGNKERKPTPSPPTVALTALSCQNGSSSSNCSVANPNSGTVHTNQSSSKEAWPSLQPGVPTTGTNCSGSETGSSSVASSSSSISSASSISSNHTSTKGETNSSRRHTTKANSVNKKRHNSTDEHRTSGRTHDGDAENDGSAIPTERILSSGGRLLSASHRAATLFEPDNNSFFSSNNFTKVTATTTGSGPEWPVNGVALTNMPDVLPPVHSSEDWQAAFGFSDSTNLENLQRETSPILPAVADSPPSSASYDAIKDNEENEPGTSQHISLQGAVTVQSFMSQSSHSTSLESLTSNLVQNSPEVFRGNDVEHLNHQLSSYTLDDRPPTVDNDCSSSSTASLHSAVCSENLNASHIYPGNHPATFVQEQPVFVVSQHHYIPSSASGAQPHLVHNGILPAHVDFHLRQTGQVQNSQQSQIPLQMLNQCVLDSASYGRHMVDEKSDAGFITSSDCGSAVTSSNVRNASDLSNGTDLDLEEGDHYHVTHDEKYGSFACLEHQKNGIDNSSDDYLEFDHESELEHEESEPICSIKDSNGRSADDDLGFDPFHETQKALAEMIEKENTMQTVHGHQNHIPHPSQLNHLHHQYQHHVNRQLGHFSFAAQSSSGSSCSNSINKLVSGYNASQHSLLAQQGSQRLLHNLTGCNKVLEGVGHIPPRARLPPPGFTTAPNHMNAFGLGIPRAPTNSGSKILPFMGLGNSSSSSNSGTPCLSQPLNNMVNTIGHSITLNNQANGCSSSVLFPHTHVHGNTTSQYSLPNGTSSLLKTTADSFSVKEWPENLRTLLPNLNDDVGGKQSPFSGRSTPSPPSSQNSSFSSQTHPSVQSNAPKTWSSVGPCSDWTALDPAIMSSSRAHSFLPSTAASSTVQHPLVLQNTNSHLNHHALNSQYLHIQTTTQWLRSLNGESCLLYGANSQNVGNSEWNNSIAPPPPGFTLRMTSAQQMPATVPNKSTVPLTQEMTKIGS